MIAVKPGEGWSIRRSGEPDIPRILEIYEGARKYMAENGNPNQWGPTNWPPEELIRNDIREGSSYVCTDEEGEIIATFYYTKGDDPEKTYREIYEGSWRDSEPYAVVHRIASAGKRSGAGKFCINWAYEDSGHLRMDTHGDNHIMQNLLESLGFERRGIIYVEEDDYPRIAYEK